MKSIVIEICMGTSCYLLGTQDLLGVIEGLSKERRAKVEVIGATCLNTCGKGPNIKINGIVLSNIMPETLLQILNDNV